MVAGLLSLVTTKYGMYIKCSFRKIPRGGGRMAPLPPLDEALYMLRQHAKNAGNAAAIAGLPPWGDHCESWDKLQLFSFPLQQMADSAVYTKLSNTCVATDKLLLCCGL